MLNPRPTLALVALGLALAAAGCSKQEPGARIATTPAEAASQLETTFAAASPETQAGAREAAEALRTDNYEKAVVSLGVVRAAPNVTIEQGVAIHSSVVNLEARLIAAMESGDPNAKRAYELLKAMKRK